VIVRQPAEGRRVEKMAVRIASSQPLKSLMMMLLLVMTSRCSKSSSAEGKMLQVLLKAVYFIFVRIFLLSRRG